MKALILCGGKGSRLSPLTDTQPKCMVDVAGKPVLKRIVDYLHTYHIYDIVINIHKYPEQVMKYFGNDLLYYYEPEPLGEHITEQNLRVWLGDQYLVMNGDTLTDLALDRMVNLGKDKHLTVESISNGIYTGIKFVNINCPTLTYNFHCWWQDMGTPEGLKKAIQYYEAVGSMSNM